MKPYYQDDAVTIYHGDACAVLAQLPDQSVDILMTDPPYSSGGMFLHDRAQDPKVKYLADGSGNNALGTFNGDSRSELGHLFWCASWLTRCTQLLKPGGVGGLFTDWRQLPATIMALQAGGFIWRGIVVWHKPAARPVQGRWTNQCEYLVWGTNGPRSLEGSPLPGFYTCNAPRDRDHITEKPLELMRALLALCPDRGVVLDPFIGSGTTLRAAKDLGLQAIGVELDAANCEIAAKRMGQEVLPL